MQVFDCKVRLAGNVLNEVPKSGVSAPEVILLQHIHGNDAVVGLSLVSDTARRDAEERDRLNQEYGEKVVKEVFGITSLPLPTELSGYGEDEEIDPKELVRRRVKRPAEPAPAGILS